MNIETLQFELQALEDICIGPDDINDSGHNRHFHPYWELKVYEFDERPRMVMTPPETLHGETHHFLLVSGWVLHCREPMLNLTFRNKLNAEVKDFLLPWNSIDFICPGGITAVIEAIALAARSGNADIRLLNAIQNTLWAAVFHVLRFSVKNSTLPLSLVDMAKYHIDRNYYRPTLSVAGVASHIGVTAGYLANLFKQMEDVTVRRYIINVRMSHALRLLRSNNYTVQEVAEMSGWNCQFYFSNCFKKRFGVSPSQAAELIYDDHSVTI
jgi:AraC-like DNA-binding protein